MDKKYVFHLLANAHLDPVWLWDWREGLNEGIATCRTMLKFFDKYPEFTFIRGEASIYEHLEKYDQESFARIRELVKSGRWDIIGGNYVQTDTNMPGTATFLKQYEYGRRYFKEKFNFDVKAAWAPDSFGHSGGLPEIYAASGFKYFAFSRQVSDFPQLSKPVFQWVGQGGSRILTLFNKIGWYGSNRDEMPRRLDQVLESAPNSNMTNLAVFFGLGNHGGGSSQRQIEDILRWRDAHPDVEVKFSTLHGYFAACEAESSDYPEYQGEINFCLRGCTSSAAKIKTKFRQTEAINRRAEFVIRTAAGVLNVPPADLSSEWRGTLFNSFHDILPGSSIERANYEQIEWMDQIIHNCRSKEFEALNQLANAIDIRVKTPEYDMPEAVPFVIFNPRPSAYSGPVEIECSMDYRSIAEYENRDAMEVPVELLDEQQRPVPFQAVATEHNAMKPWPWRRRVVTNLEIPAGGWRMVSLGYVKQPDMAEFCAPLTTAEAHGIANEFFRVEALCGEGSLRIWRGDKPVLAADGLEFATYEDRFGSWGAMDEAPEGWRCDKRLQTWTITEVKILESGPERSAMFVIFEGGKSQIQLHIRLYRQMDMVEFKSRIIWQDRACRLRMVMDHADSVTYAVPGGTVERCNPGDVPGGRWLKLNGYGLASDAFCGFTNLEKNFCVNLIRGCRNASDEVGKDAEYLERAITDYGEHLANFAITGPGFEASEAADRIELPLVQVMSYPHQGKLPCRPESYVCVTPSSVKLLDWDHVQQQSDEAVTAIIRVVGQPSREMRLEPWKIYKIGL